MFEILYKKCVCAKKVFTQGLKYLLSEPESLLFCIVNNKYMKYIQSFKKL